MLDLSTQLTSLNRPNLLVRTARTALDHFNRDAILPRIFGCELCDNPTEVLTDLINHEAYMNAQRKSGDATYSIARHIMVLTALMYEAAAYFQRKDLLT